jgi:hypothetical protein
VFKIVTCFENRYVFGKSRQLGKYALVLKIGTLLWGAAPPFAGVGCGWGVPLVHLVHLVTLEQRRPRTA